MKKNNSSNIDIVDINNTTVIEPEDSQKKDKKISYVVTRDGYRVSDVEYDIPDDPNAIEELNFWKNVSKKYSHKEIVEIVKYDNKLHRVWKD